MIQCRSSNILGSLACYEMRTPTRLETCRHVLGTNWKRWKQSVHWWLFCVCCMGGCAGGPRNHPDIVMAILPLLLSQTFFHWIAAHWHIIHGQSQRFLVDVAIIHLKDWCFTRTVVDFRHQMRASRGFNNNPSLAMMTYSVNHSWAIWIDHIYPYHNTIWVGIITTVVFTHIVVCQSPGTAVHISQMTSLTVGCSPTMIVGWYWLMTHSHIFQQR